MARRAGCQPAGAPGSHSGATCLKSIRTGTGTLSLECRCIVRGRYAVQYSRVYCVRERCPTECKQSCWCRTVVQVQVSTVLHAHTPGQHGMACQQHVVCCAASHAGLPANAEARAAAERAHHQHQLSGKWQLWTVSSSFCHPWAASKPVLLHRACVCAYGHTGRHQLHGLACCGPQLQPHQFQSSCSDTTLILLCSAESVNST